MFRFVPPAGTPIAIRQLFRALGHSLHRNGSDETQVQQLASHFHVRHVLSASSGRTALSCILRALHRLRPKRDVVAIPAYTCFSVPASIVRAGLMIYPVDIESNTMALDPAQVMAMPSERLLCLITCNLFGIVDDVKRFQEIARARGAYLVDDAAQALGAVRGESLAGTGGDVGLYSLGRGKALSTGEGGIIVSNNDEIASSIRTEIDALPRPSIGHEARLFLELLAYSLFVNPRLYWIPNSLPFLNLGVTEFNPDFSACRLANLSRSLLPVLMERLEETNRCRLLNAERLVKTIAGCSNFSTLKPEPGSLPTYIRFPVMARDESSRDRAVARLRAAGIGASGFYPTAICDIPGIGRHMALQEFHQPRAEGLARRLLTLPTHHLVTGEDLERIAAILRTG